MWVFSMILMDIVMLISVIMLFMEFKCIDGWDDIGVNAKKVAPPFFVGGLLLFLVLYTASPSTRDMRLSGNANEYIIEVYNGFQWKRTYTYGEYDAALKKILELKMEIWKNEIEGKIKKRTHRVMWED